MEIQIGTVHYLLVSWGSTMHEKLRGRRFFGVECINGKCFGRPTQAGVCDSDSDWSENY